MSIHKYKRNLKYLTKDFIVPLYTGTEPDIIPKTIKEILENILEDYQLRKVKKSEDKENV